MPLTSRRKVLVCLLIHTLLLQTLAAISPPATNPPTAPVSLLNSTRNPTSLAPNRSPTSQNATTSPGDENNNKNNNNLSFMFDYRIVGTPLMLRLTENGQSLTQLSVNEVIDAAIQRVVATINKGSGSDVVEHGRFWQMTEEIDLRVITLPDKNFTYFLLGDVLAGLWQFMHEPWSSFREVVFDVLRLRQERWDYVAYGRLTRYESSPDALMNAVE